MNCPECGFSKIYKDGLRYTNEEQTQSYLCRVCGYRFSKPHVKVNVAGKIREMPKSGKNHHEVRVFSGDASDEKVYDCLPFALGKDVTSHNISIAERA